MEAHVMEALGPQMKECLVPLVDAIRQACGTSGISCPESRQTVSSAGVSDIPIKTMLNVLSLLVIGMFVFNSML